MTKYISTEEQKYWEAFADRVYQASMSGKFHDKTGLKILPLSGFIREEMCAYHEERMREVVEKLKGEIMSRVDFAMYLCKKDSFDVDKREEVARAVEKEILALLTSHK